MNLFIQLKQTTAVFLGALLFACFASQRSAQAQFKDFDVVATAWDANGFPLNPKWGQQARNNTLPDPTVSCPLSDTDTLHWTGSEHCTSFPVTFNSGDWCGHHVNFMTVTYEGRIEWNGTGPRPWDMDYTFNVYRDDQALYIGIPGYGTVHIEFDSRETVDQWDGTGTWWEQFRKGFDKKGDIEAQDLIDGRQVIVIGQLNLDSPHSGKSELHPVYAIFVRTGQNPRFRTHTWSFFVRNWGNQGSCGAGILYFPEREHRPIKVQIPNAARVVRSKIRKGARHADMTEVTYEMPVSFQPKDGGMELTFTMLRPFKESWIMGDITFERGRHVPEPERGHHFPPSFEAVIAQINKLPKTSQKKLFAELRRVVVRKPGQRLTPRIIAEPTQVGEVQLKSPEKVEPKGDLVRPEKDSIGELNRRRQLEVLRKFFAKRGVHVELPPE